MHFKPFWMPCLHIKFFTSAPIPELTAVENFTKRWNGMLGSLSDFKNQFKSRKVLIRLDRNPSIRNEEKKVLIGSEFMFQEGAKLSKYRFFMLLLLRILVRNKTYMLSDWIFLKNILIGQISSHRWMRKPYPRTPPTQWNACEVTAETRLHMPEITATPTDDEVSEPAQLV